MATRRPGTGPTSGAPLPGGWERAWRAVGSRRVLGSLTVSLLVAFLVGTGVLAYRLLAARQELKAQALLGEALGRTEIVTDSLRGGTPEDLKPEAVQEALGGFQKVREQYPGSRAAGFALLQMGHLEYRLGRYAEAARSYEAYLAEDPRGPFAFWAAMGQGYSLEGSGDWDRALRVYQAAAERHAGTPPAAEALMGVARCHEAVTRLKEAEAVYTEIMRKYPNTVWGSLAERRLAFLEAS